MSKTGIRARCAIYTRKSSEEGLEQSFNSLHAQREACEAFILSQRHEGWSSIETLFDDGGFSGGTIERPRLRALLAEITAGNVDVVVVYKIDRLTRSLFDFAKIVETFDAHKVSFVSVTQAFNTTTSMGRLTLNVLLSFAQFEREVTGERIRDKVAASKKKGMWMGGNIPLGYELKDRKLIIHKREAETVRTVFRLYAELGAVRKVKAEVDRLGLRTKLHVTASGAARGGLPFRKGHLYTILRNGIYRGEIHHKGQVYAGDHDPIVDQILWDAARARLVTNAATRRSGKNSKEPSLLAGLLFDGGGNRMTPSHTVRRKKRYRYYISNHLISGSDRGGAAGPESGLRLAAQELEGHVVTALMAFLTDPQRLIAELYPNGVSPAAAGAVIRVAASLSGDLESKSGETHETIRTLIAQIHVLQDRICVALKRQSLFERLGVPYDDVVQPDAPLELTVPVELRRLGKEKRLIVTDALPRSRPDATLIKAVTRAHHWFEMLKSRAVESITDIAKGERLPRTYVGSIVPLALLAPDITSAILDGTQPIDLNLDKLITTALPLEWAEQRAVLGFK